MGYQREVLLVLCRYTCCPLLLGCAGILGLLGLPGSYHCCSAGCVSVSVELCVWVCSLVRKLLADGAWLVRCSDHDSLSL